MTQKYILTEDVRDWPTGTIVYPLKGWDYGCANDDRKALGIRCRSMTRSPSGDYPFSVIPEKSMKLIDPSLAPEAGKLSLIADFS